jgi:hypothetical protein
MPFRLRSVALLMQNPGLTELHSGPALARFAMHDPEVVLHPTSTGGTAVCSTTWWYFLGNF